MSGLKYSHHCGESVVLPWNIDICCTQTKTCRNWFISKLVATHSHPAWENALKLFAPKLRELLITLISLQLLVSFRKAGWKMWNGWTLPFSDLYSSVTTVRRLPVSHPAAVKLRPFSTPCRRVRVIPQRSTVKSSAPGLQAQPGWMPHKFTTHSLCYALLYPEGWEKCVALARWGRSLSTYQEKELFLKKKKKKNLSAVQSEV